MGGSTFIGWFYIKRKSFSELFLRFVQFSNQYIWSEQAVNKVLLKRTFPKIDALLLMFPSLWIYVHPFSESAVLVSKRGRMCSNVTPNMLLKRQKYFSWKWVTVSMWLFLHSISEDFCIQFPLWGVKRVFSLGWSLCRAFIFSISTKFIDCLHCILLTRNWEYKSEKDSCVALKEFRFSDLVQQMRCVLRVQGYGEVLGTWEVVSGKVKGGGAWI